MATEKTLFIIKPEAFQKRKEIKEYVLNNSNLRIVDSEVLVLTEKDIESVYVDDLGTPLLSAMKEHLLGKPVEVCIAEGESAVEAFLDLAGRDFDVKKCPPHTLRSVFGEKDTIRYGEITYHLNAVHKSGPTEVQSAIDWFYGRRT